MTEYEINEPKAVYNVETPGETDKIVGLSKAKNVRGWIQGRKYVFRNNPEINSILQGFLQVYNKFHPEMKSRVALKGWKGKSGFNVIQYPDYFDVIDWRKEEPNSKPKEMSHKVSKDSLNRVLKTLSKLSIGDKCKTREFAKIWAKTNEIYKNNEGKDIFGEDGFNFSNISGCRATYFDLYYPLKVLEFYKMIEYKKSGKIIKLKNNFETNCEFV